MKLPLFVLVSLLALPTTVLAECDATFSSDDKVGDVKKKLSCFAAENADLKRQLQSMRPRFSDGQWRYFAMPGATGIEVARRLTEIGPPQDALIVSYDGSSNNTFHIWYRGQGTSTRYTYNYGVNGDLKDPPRMNYFLTEPGVVPAGIGGVGNTPVPIWFVATR